MHFTSQQLQSAETLLRQAISHADVSIRDRLRIRMALSPLRPMAKSRILETVSTDLCCNNFLTQDGDLYGIDLDAILAFIRELLPLILEIIAIFS